MVTGAFAYLAAAFLGILAGAMLLIALAIVPFWQSLEPAEFALWFQRYSPLLGRIMIPLAAAATVLTLVAAGLVRSVVWFALAAALALAVAAVYPLYFSAANETLTRADTPATEIAAELQRWCTWHWARTVAGLLAFLCALAGLAAFRS